MKNVKIHGNIIKIGIVCLVVLFLLILCLVLVLAKKIHPNEWFVRSYQVKGTDISHYQGKTDMGSWENEDIDFVYIKATEGSSHVDEQFEENWNEAEGRKWDFWQYTDTAQLGGYQGEEKYIDCNVFRGTLEELEEYRLP